MKHISPSQVASESPVKIPTRRALAKQQTRAKVLAAARRLFSEHGYEGAASSDQDCRSQALSRFISDTVACLDSTG